nr:putative reverse transcriptase domain-containing protein [Tanacetum cinerariifolium]
MFFMFLYSEDTSIILFMLLLCQDSLEEPSRAGSHLGNRGVYPDFLSSFPSMIWKSGMVAGIKVEEEIIRDLERLDIELYVSGRHGYWASQIKEAQKEDSEIWTIVENLDKQVEF